MKPPDLLDHPLISERYFFPRPDTVDDPFIVEGAGGKLRCALVAPHGAGARTIIHFHGNGETAADYLDSADDFTRLGVNVLFAEYRGYGRSDGTPALGGMLDDVEPIFRALGRPAKDVIAFGRSLGSLPAVELAARHPDLGGLIIESGICDALSRLELRVTPDELGVSADEMFAAVAERLSQKTKMESYAGPLLVLHARHDDLIPVGHAEYLHRWGAGPAASKRLVIFERGDHNSIQAVNRDAYWNAIAAFLARA
jgi:pimeloyl-ACP methyl ester carboxylesterase